MDHHSDNAVQETCLDEVEVDDDGNLKPSEHHDTDTKTYGDESLQPLNRGDSEQASAAGNSDVLSSRERQSFKRRQSEKDEYAREGTPEEYIPMVVAHEDDELSNSSGSYLGLGKETYPELSAARAVGSLSGASVHDAERQSGEIVMHDNELSVYNGPDASSAADAHTVEQGDPPPPKKEYCGNLSGLLDLIITFFTKSSPQKLAIFFAIVAVIVGLLLMLGLLPTSFIYIEYHQLALAKNTVTGTVDRDNVYYPGCYLLTPAFELIHFQGSAHTLDLNVEISTSDRLAFHLGVSLQYFIKPSQLGMLHRDYEKKYHNVVEMMVISTIKNEGSKFSLDHYRLSRLDVEEDFRQALAYKLGGDCCAACCPDSCGSNINCRSCKLPGRCSSYGIHMDMKYFQMGIIDIPDDIAERFLRKTILQVEAEKELFIQQHAVETKISKLQQKQILNQAAEIRQRANATASKIRMTAEADYDRQLQGSYVEALKKLYTHLNITQEDHKLSLMYIRALKDISDKLYNLNYDQYISLGKR